MGTAIGPTFAEELKAAGLTGLPFAWGADGSVTFSDGMTPEQIAAVQAVHAAHDPGAAAKAPVDTAADLRAALASVAKASGVPAAVKNAFAALGAHLRLG